MENKIVHPKLGEFIEKVLKVAHVNLSKMCPALTVSMVEMQLSSVVFPEPEAPIMPMNSPSWT